MSIVNPVGNASVKHVNDIVKVTAVKWSGYVTKDWSAIVQFLLASVETGAKFLDSSGLLNEDKKATLLVAASNLYDNVVAGLLPIYLKPFNSYIKQFLINVVLNVFIDYIVGKIHELETLQKK